MLGWYHPFMLAAAFVWLLSTERDRTAARVVLVATLVSHFIITPIQRQIMEPWMLLIPGAVETLTILALLRWARGVTGCAQIGLLCVAWLAHVLCYVDIRLNTDVIYSRYESTLALVAVAQIAAFHDTFSHNLRGLAAWCAGIGLPRSGAVHSSGLCDPVLRDSSLRHL